MQRAFLISLLLWLSPLTAWAAGPYDGSWNGAVTGGPVRATARGADCASGEAHIVALDNAVTGRVNFTTGVPTIHGTIASDGTFTGTLTRAGQPITLTGKFSGNTFTGQWLFTNCVFDVALTRAKAP